MKHRRFITRLLNRPQMIAAASGAAVVAALMPGAQLFGYDDAPAQDVRDSNRDYQVIGTTAVIPIIGELVHRGGSMDAMSGVASYEALADMIADAIEDPGVTGMVLDIDSPGGEAAGCLDFAEWLAAQRGIIPMVASINQEACSGAYAIASACDQVLIGQDGYAGSIGVVGYHTDLSQALDKAGVKITYLYAGAHKIDGASALPFTDQARTEWQTQIDATYERFCAVVAANRGLSVDAVRGTEAAIYRGTDAVSAGLADAIATPEEAMMAAQPTARTAPRGSRMAAEAVAADPVTDPVAAPVTEPAVAPAVAEPPVPDAPVVAAPLAVATACTAAGHADLIAGLLQQGASMAAVTARIEEAGAIKEAAVKAGVPSMAAGLIRAGVSLEVARGLIFDARAAGSDAVRTDTANGNAQHAEKPTHVAAGADLRAAARLQPQGPHRGITQPPRGQ